MLAVGELDFLLEDATVTVFMEDLGERLIGPTRVFYLDHSAVSDSITVWSDIRPKKA